MSLRSTVRLKDVISSCAALLGLNERDAKATTLPSSPTISRAKMKIDAVHMASRRREWNTPGMFDNVFVQLCAFGMVFCGTAMQFALELHYYVLLAICCLLRLLLEATIRPSARRSTCYVRSSRSGPGRVGAL